MPSVLPLIPYLFSLTVTVGVAIYAWNHRRDANVMFFLVAVLGQVLWIAAFILELILSPLWAKTFLDSVQFLGGGLWSVGLLRFSINFTNLKLESKIVWRATLAVGAGLMLLVFTDDFHHLLRHETVIETVHGYAALYYESSPLLLLLYMCYLGILAVVIGLLLRTYFESQGVFKKQSGMILVGTIIPVVGTILSMIGAFESLQRDISPLTFGIGDLFIAWGIYQYKFFDLQPVPFSEILNNVQDGIIILDQNDRIVELNEAAKRYIPKQQQFPLGRNVRDVFTQHADLFGTDMDDKRGEIEMHLEPGTLPAVLALHTNRLRGNDGTSRGHIVVIHDITEVKRASWRSQAHMLQLERANVELEAANRELEKVNRRLNTTNTQLAAMSESKDAYVSNVSHELRTPIASLKVNLYMLRRKPERAPELVTRLERDVDQLGGMVEDLLLLSRLDQNRADFEPEELDLNPLVQAHVKDRVAVARAAEIDLTCSLGPAVLPVWGDPGLLVQTLSTLLANALHYTPSGGSIAVNTFTILRNSEPWSGFSVSDTGRGIAPEDQAKIFDRFYRSRDVIDLGKSGSGLGLSIAKAIVDLHMGEISVKSTGIDGEGTCFTVAIPAFTSQTDYPTERFR